MSFFDELKRRNVVRVGVVYLIVAWLLAQVADLMLENFNAPDWVIQAILVVLIVGFPLALVFAWAFELTPEGIKKEKDVDREKSITHITGRKLDRSIIVVLLAAVAFLLADKFFLEPHEMVTKPEAVAREVPAQKEKAKSVAVLPFVNMSSDPEQEYFSDGISEEILNSLAKVQELKVAGRTSSFAFKGQKQDLRQIGETLGVEHILEGSVRKSGTKVRITAQLIQVEDGFHLWSESYDRELTDVFAIQDEIANAILEQLLAKLIGEEIRTVAAARTNSEAFDNYLLAKQRIYERSRLPLESAAELLDEAISLDPDYAPAYAQRGITTLLLDENNYGDIPAEQAAAQAKLYIDKALALDPGLAEAHAALGLYHLNRPGESQEAVTALRRALSINPNLVNAANWLSTSLTDTEQHHEANRVLDRMIERDPLYRPGINNAVFRYNSYGQSDKSWALIERVSPFMPNDPLLLRVQAMTHLAEGHAGDALPLAEAALEQMPDNFSNRGALSVCLAQTMQYERLEKVGTPGWRVAALYHLDRIEEATIVASELASSGEDVTTLFWLLAQTGRHEELVEFFESRWSNFDAFEADYPPLGSGSVDDMGFLAQAYGARGNEEKAANALARFRANLDRAHAFGFQFSFLNVFEAAHATLAGDYKAALAYLGKAVDEGILFNPRISKDYRPFRALEGDPDYEAIQARMVEHLNAERAKVGLEPLAI